MSSLFAEHGSVFAAADRLLSRNARGEEAERWLHGLLESLYRLARTPLYRQELRSWLERYAPDAEITRPWLFLVRLAESTEAEAWQATLEALNHLLPVRNARANLYLRTEAARQVHRLADDATLAEACFHSKDLPDPKLRETAVDAVLLRLRLSAVAGDWQEHDRLSILCNPRWIRSAGPQAGWVKVVIAEHAIQRGAYAAALELLAKEDENTEGRLRFAVLQTRLRALLAVGGDLPREPIAEKIARTAALLEPLLTEGPPADEEGQIRFQRARQLVDRARSGKVPIEPGNEEAALAEIEEALLRGPGPNKSPEAFLRRLLQWVNLILNRCGSEVAEICESLLSSMIVEADRRGLKIIELLARDRRAIVRARYLGLLKEGIEDAGDAADLCLLQLAANQTLDVEQGLRSSLLPIFDRALELLAEASQLEPATKLSRREERFGRALLDYGEQLADLALSEARIHIQLAGTKSPGIPVAGDAPRKKRSENLQAALRPTEAVLQYLLVGRFLLIFVYGRSFFAWEVQKPEIDDSRSPLPIRTYLESYLGSWRRTQAEHWSRNGIREVGISDVPESARVWDSPQDCLRELADFLIPQKIAKAIDRHRVRHLSIVPHDVLYRTPFGSLPWRKSHLGARFTLSLHPTGELAGLSADASRWADKLPIKIGFFKGPGLTHTDAEREALIKAFHTYGEITPEDTTQEKKAGGGLFVQTAPGYDIIHLACHGSETRLSLGPEGSPGISLREAARIDLHRCRVAVLQACRTGWMSHRREFPVQGFPQALLDAGAAAVVAPMFPVHDALCPVFASTFGRAVRFLTVCEALGFTLKVLRRYGAVLLAGSAETEPFSRMPHAFDAYEYRFTGDPDLRLPGGWLRRGLSLIGFAVWLGREVFYRRWLMPGKMAESGSLQPDSTGPTSG